MYRIDLQTLGVGLVPCTFVPSTVVPGKTLCVNEDGSALVVLPDGSQRVTSEPPGPNWDSPWTQGEVYGDLLVYRSSDPSTKGTPRAYRMVV